MRQVQTLRHPAGQLSAWDIFASFLGGLALALALGRLAMSFPARYSPTATARECFHYPEIGERPDAEAMTQLLLSQAFFGNDALYFDSGEENTGLSSLPDPPHAADPLHPSSPANPSEGEAEGVIRPPSAFTWENLYLVDRSAVAVGESALVPYDLSGSAAPGQILLSNTTAYELDGNVYAARAYPMHHEDAIAAGGGTGTAFEPLVLILHTHGTEAFAPEGKASVPATSAQRSTNPNETIVAVGAVMAEQLNTAGIPTLHCTVMHDRESYRNSYNYSADTIQRLLAEYPSIRYVFDVHRDAIVRTNGDLIKPLTLIDGQPAAQIMLLVGTDEKGADHPDWANNLTVAAHLQARLTQKYERFARPINIRGASFNEQFTTGSLLIEIGSAANTLTEAKTAARALTWEIIHMIRENAS